MAFQSSFSISRVRRATATVCVTVLGVPDPRWLLPVHGFSILVPAVGLLLPVSMATIPSSMAPEVAQIFLGIGDLDGQLLVATLATGPRCPRSSSPESERRPAWC